MKREPESQPAPAEVRRINWFGREVVVIDNGGRLGRPGKFTADQIAEFRAAVATTPIAELARRHGVSRQHMSYLIYGRRSPNPAKPGTPGGPWTAKEDRLVRTLRTAAVVARTGRSAVAVQARRRQLGVPPVVRHYTPKEDKIVLRLATPAAAAKTGRSPQSINDRRYRLLKRAKGAHARRVK
ncbi:MAG TPA: hypothetical protein VKE40_19175 [Gemmataceae bacterium]|nr:hypothetical protein [Gemmataceae bacterium]